MFDRMTTVGEDRSEVDNILTILLEMLCSQDKESHGENVQIFQVSNGCHKLHGIHQELNKRTRAGQSISEVGIVG